MRSFVLGIFIFWLALGFIPAYQTAENTWNKRMPSSCFGVFCCNRKPSEPNALENLMAGNEKTYLFRSPNRMDSLEQGQFKVASQEIVIQVNQKIPFRVGVDKAEKTQINILTKTDDNYMKDLYNFSPCGNQLAYFLPFQENLHTFMFWEWGKADWFFTDNLGGCDMFVAKSEVDQTKKALIIHSNLNKYKSEVEQETNLRLKGAAAKEIVDAFPGYRIVMRLYTKPTHPKALRYMQQYEKYHNAYPSMGRKKIYLYNYDAATIFFGLKAKFYAKPMFGGETKELNASVE